MRPVGCDGAFYRSILRRSVDRGNDVPGARRPRHNGAVARRTRTLDQGGARSSPSGQSLPVTAILDPWKPGSRLWGGTVLGLTERRLSPRDIRSGPQSGCVPIPI